MYLVPRIGLEPLLVDVRKVIEGLHRAANRRVGDVRFNLPFVSVSRVLQSGPERGSL